MAPPKNVCWIVSKLGGTLNGDICTVNGELDVSMELTDILICPSTGSRLRFNDGNSVVRVDGTDVTIIYLAIDLS